MSSDYENRRYSGPCEIPLCTQKSFRRRLCKFHYNQRALLSHHCSKLRCIRPIFYNTLCRTHYKQSVEKCKLCNKFIFCKQLCITHYRKFGRKMKHDLCKKCNKKKVYIKGLCFNDYIEHISPDFLKTCMYCTNKKVCRGMCKKHYQQWRRKNITPTSD